MNPASHIQSGRWVIAVEGIVTKNDDPDRQHRIKVKIPIISETEEYGWVKRLVNFAGQKLGDFFPPPIGSEVILFGRLGQPHHMYYLSVYNEDLKVPDEARVKPYPTYLIKTGQGLMLLFDDWKDQEKVQLLALSMGLVMDEDPAAKSLKLSNGGKYLLLDENNDIIELFFDSATRYLVQAGLHEFFGNVTINGDLTVTGNVNITGNLVVGGTGNFTGAVTAAAHL